MKKKDLQRWLRSYRGRDLDLSAHVVRDKIKLGVVKEKDIRDNLENPDALVRFVEQGADNPNTSVYKVHFRLSSNKTLGVVIKLNETIKVITAWEVYEPWQRKVNRKWKK